MGEFAPGFPWSKFTDAVNSRVKLTDAKQLKGGGGLAAETARVWDGGARRLSLRGSVDVEQTLRGGVTAVEVSGERLRSGTKDNPGSAGSGRGLSLGPLRAQRRGDSGRPGFG